MLFNQTIAKSSQHLQLLGHPANLRNVKVRVKTFDLYGHHDVISLRCFGFAFGNLSLFSQIYRLSDILFPVRAHLLHATFVKGSVYLSPE